MFRPKDEIALGWARIRRRLTRDFDTQLQDLREEILNSLLNEAYKEYSRAAVKGEIIELDTASQAWVAAALKARGIRV